MQTRFRNAAAALALVTVGANADIVAPLQAESLDLGAYNGVVYFEQVAEGWQVVTTVAGRDEDAGPAMRYVANLTEGQVQTLIVGGADPYAVELARTSRGLAVYVVKPAVAAR